MRRDENVVTGQSGYEPKVFLRLCGDRRGKRRYGTFVKAVAVGEV